MSPVKCSRFLSDAPPRKSYVLIFKKKTSICKSNLIFLYNFLPSILNTLIFFFLQIISFPFLNLLPCLKFYLFMSFVFFDLIVFFLFLFGIVIELFLAEIAQYSKISSDKYLICQHCLSDVSTCSNKD